jgi:hypothetical protein
MTEKIQIGHQFFREMTEGERWAPHPVSGIIVVHPDREPLWCRMEHGAFVQSWLEPDPAVELPRVPL